MTTAERATQVVEALYSNLDTATLLTMIEISGQNVRALTEQDPVLMRVTVTELDAALGRELQRRSVGEA